VLGLDRDHDQVGVADSGSFDGGKGRDAEARRDGRARVGTDLDDRQRVRRLAARDQSADHRPRHVAAADERDIQVVILATSP
jgi:hypothetical protein